MSIIASMSTECRPFMLEMRSGQLKVPKSFLRFYVVSPRSPASHVSGAETHTA